MKRTNPTRILLVFTLVLAGVDCRAGAATPPPSHGVGDSTPPPAAATAPPVVSPNVQDPTPESVQAKLDELASNTALDAATREQASALYKSALSRLETARQSAAAAAEFRHALETTPQALTDARARLAATTAERGLGEDAPPPAALASDADGATVAQLEQRLARLQAEAAELRKGRDGMEESLRAMLGRPEAIGKEVSAEKKTIEEVDRNLVAPTPAGESPVVSGARNTAQRARRLASVRLADALEEELLSLPLRRDLLTAQRDLAAAEVLRMEGLADELQKTLTARRVQVAREQQQQAEQTRRDVAGLHPILAGYAEQNAVLSRQAATVSGEIAAAVRAQAATKSQIDLLRDNDQTARQLLEIGAVGEEYGVLLQEIRSRLPNTSSVQTQIRKRERELVETRLQRLRMQEDLRQLLDVEGVVDRLLAGVPAGEAADIRPTLRELVASRKESLARLADSCNERVRVLTAVNADARELATKREALALVLNARLLWLPSAPALNRAWWTDIAAGTQWFAQSGEWREVGRLLWSAARSRPVGALFLLTIVILLLTARRRLKARTELIAGLLGRIATDRFGLTMQVLVICLLMAVPWPALLGYLGGLLCIDTTNTGFPLAVGTGLLGSAVVLLILRTFQTMCRPQGLFSAHFGWGPQLSKRLRIELGWLMLLESAAAFIVATCNASGVESTRAGLGRLAFLAGSLGLAVFMYRVFSPRRGATAEFIVRTPMLWRFRHLWFPLAVGIPAGVGVLAALGYYETAAAVQSRVFTTAWISLVAMILYSLAIRWLLVVQRRIAYGQAIERREKARAARVKESTDSPGEAGVLQPEEPQINISQVSQQTRTLLRFVMGLLVATALWAIWSKLFPAVRVLDQVLLWSQVVNGPEGEKVVPVTAWNLAQAAVVLIIAWVATRNLPSLIEIAILQRLTIASGTRYTIATITRYLIISVGLVLALNTIGADWSKMQWIVAALGVGLGFGLQEIVANFVSGLIILFEQPVRVGDLVTVGDQIGMVSRIKIRATTIVDPDNREVIIPNKAFITERVTNWALSDPITRVVVKVGIAYGSDTNLAHRVLLETVNANPLVLDTPAPAVLFMGFGDSSLNFEVRVYVREIANRLPLTHELHMAIDRALRANKIEIPFPQRDLHLRSADGVVVVARMDRQRAEGTEVEKN